MKPLTIPGKLESLDSVTSYVLQAATRAGLDYRASYRLRLAVDEITTNIILHGLDDEQAAGTITMSAEMDEAYLTIHIEDTGTGYNPYEALPPDKMWGPIETRRLGGWGIYLAMWGVDQYHYSRIRECNRSTLKVQRPCKYH
ncbi:MAG: ATP-binding protein [Ardenticatenaceae bacterium]|nr:ATP-binding protein [Anaerolineales bacterium]MCB8923720.1 ATP-binding protein [Ardenticatenaceae bacterium]MCB9005710.1 ATP-binding protein [Ardenticatenaceae bacterium]